MAMLHIVRTFLNISASSDLLTFPFLFLSDTLISVLISA